MDSRKISRKFPYKQSPTRVSRDVAEGIEKLREQNIDGGNILDVYIESQKYSAGKKWIINPMRYVSACEQKDKNIPSLRFRDLEPVYNNVVPKWADIPPDKFIEQFESYVYQQNNESGWETGFISEGIFGRAQDDENILVVDPSPAFFRECKAKDKDITVAYSEQRYYEAYSAAKKLKELRVISRDSITSEKYQKALCFGSYYSQHEIIDMLEDVRVGLVPQKSVKIYLVTAAKYLEKRKSESALWDFINQHFTVERIILIDEKVVQNTPKRRAVVILQNEPIKNRNMQILIQKTRLLDSSHFATLDFHRVPFVRFLGRDRTLSEMYEKDYIDYSKSDRRNRAEEYKFSEEISVWMSFAKREDGNIRPSFSIYHFPTAEQLRRNTLPRGKPIITKIPGKWYCCRVEAANAAEYLLLDNSNAAKEMRKVVRKEFEGKPLSLKSLIFLHLKDSNKTDDGFDEALCHEVFFRPQSAQEPICSLLVGAADEEEIRNIVEAFVKDQNFSETKVTRLWKQLELAFFCAVVDGRCKRNPICGLIHNQTAKKKNVKEMRATMIKDSLEEEKEEKLIGYLLADKEHPELAIMHLVRYYTGQPINILRALTCDDFVYDPQLDLGQLAITKAMSSRSDEVQEIMPAVNRRYVPLPSFVTRLIREKLKGKRGGKSPLFSTHKRNNKVFSSKQIQTYLNIILEDVLDMPECIVPVFEDEGAIKMVDLNDYHGDTLRRNFEHYAQRTALMEPEEIDFLLGRTPRTTEARYYCDYNNRYVQLAMRVKLDRWAGNPCEVLKAERKRHTLVLEGGNEYRIDSGPYDTRKELIIEFDVENEKDEKIDLEIFAQFGGKVQIEYYEEVE